MAIITEHFSIQEFEKSTTALRKGIDNTIPEKYRTNLFHLCTYVLEPLRQKMGIISISSGYRSAELNKAIGGSLTSQHSTGQAADIDNDGVSNGASNTEIFYAIKEHLTFDQLIWEFGNDQKPDWVHVSYNKGKNRNQILKAVRLNGKTNYSIWA